MQQNTAVTDATPVANRSASLEYLSLGEWQEFVESRRESTAFHHRSWIKTIGQQYGLELHIPCLRSGGEILAALPFLSTRSWLRGTKLYSLPFTDYLSILSCRPQAAEALISVLMSNHPPCDSMNLRTDTPLADIQTASHSVRHEVAVSPVFSDLTKRFKSSTHRNLHKARRVGLEFVRRTDAGAMEAFYRLHVLTRRKLGVPVQPKCFFERLLQCVLSRGLGYIGLVVKDSQPISAGVFLTFNNTMTYKYAASQPAALADRPNDWLVYSALRLASEEGYRAFDFGISDRKQAGLRRFKCNWGAVEIDVHTVQIVGRAKAPLSDSKLLKLTSVVIRNSPTFVCRSLGEVLYRFAI